MCYFCNIIHRHKGKIVLGLFIFIHLLFVHEKHIFLGLVNFRLQEETLEIIEAGTLMFPPR